MKGRIALVTVAALVALAPLALATSRVLAPAAEPAAAPAPPLEVGRTYGLGLGGSDVLAKVLEGPRGDWLRVEVREDGKAQALWINLRQLAYILPDPPAPKGCQTCPTAPSL